MQHYHIPGNGEPEPRSAGLTIARAFQAQVRLEYFIQKCIWYTGAVITYVDRHPQRRDPIIQRANTEGFGVVTAAMLPGTRFVQAFNAVDSWAIADSAESSGGKMGVPLAGDDAEAVSVASRLVRDAGCEPVVVGNLLSSRKFDRGGPGWLKNASASELRKLLGM